MVFLERESFFYTIQLSEEREPMNRIHRFWLLLVLVLALLLASCGGAAEVEGGGEDPGAGEEAAAEDQLIITESAVKDGVEMKIGETALVKLDPGFTWDVVVTPNLVADKVKDATLAEGVQAEIAAKLAGSAVIQLTGKATCAKDDPPCPTPAAQMLIKIKVTP